MLHEILRNEQHHSEAAMQLLAPLHAKSTRYQVGQHTCRGMVEVVDADHHILTLGQLVPTCNPCNPQPSDGHIDCIYEKWTTTELSHLNTTQADVEQVLVQETELMECSNQGMMSQKPAVQNRCCAEI